MRIYFFNGNANVKMLKKILVVDTSYKIFMLVTKYSQTNFKITWKTLCYCQINSGNYIIIVIRYPTSVTKNIEKKCIGLPDKFLFWHLH